MHGDPRSCRTLNEQRLEDTDATNEMINDGESVQPLTAEEIQALRKSGVHASVSFFDSSVFLLILIVEH